MRMFTGPATVAGPSRTQLPFGLFSVLTAQSDASRWEAGGAQWEATTCEPATGSPMGYAYDDHADELDGELHSGEGTGSNVTWARPFAVNGYFVGSPVGHSPEGAQALAEEHLLAREQQRVEQALWTGDLSNIPNLTGAGYPSADGDGNRVTEDGTQFPYEPPTELGTFGLADAVAELEEFIWSMYGSLGVLHIPRKLAVHLLKNRLLDKHGGRLYTKLDTPVVAGSGYTGDRIIASPALFGLRSDVETMVDTVSGFDRSQNNLKAIASRSFLIGFDPCGVASATVEMNGGSEDASEVIITGTSSALPVSVENTPAVTVEGSVDVDTGLPESPTVTLSGTSDVNVTNTPLLVEVESDGGDDGVEGGGVDE